ncbi:hypothetical protein [Aurantiacibacter odishensis]|uniref:hypothetical protein n=1 Tax=Aurantiacibacter odishensis TaxID=1155476 RepID=UPI00196A7C88|nr:hypothetical protein [Aurantiacibacter odishensis]
MTVRMPILSRSRAILLAMLCVIGLHAIPTGPLPGYVERGGSAFSASTSEVSLVTREDAEIVLKVLPEPTLDKLPVSLPLAPAAAAPAFSWPGKYQTAPPVPWPMPPAANPRGPPVLS